MDASKCNPAEHI